MTATADSKRLKLLVIDDDDLVAAAIRIALPAPWRMTHATGLAGAQGAPFTAAFVDMHLTGDTTKAEGVNVIAKLRESDPHLEIVAMSGNLDRDLMEACLKAGASRFLPKPLSPEELKLTLEKIEALLLLRDVSSRSMSVAPWIGNSEPSQKTKREIASLKGEAGPILIEGESGTGKEVAAGLIHAQEGGTRPLISVNLAALPEAVFESEFFGHVRGAFTGADQNKMGLAEAAHGGDLFLDEVEALPLTQQAKLLRFLENGEVRRVGAKEAIRVSVRVIAATNRNLEQMVKEGKFREDLLWRLNGKKMVLPPLRERLADLGELANYFIERERPRRNKTLESDAIEALSTHSWPGNVRELRRVVEQMALHSPLPFIRFEDAARWLPNSALGERTGSSGGFAAENVDFSVGLNALIGNYEAELIRQAMARENDVDKTALLLGISRSSLYKKIKDYKL
ncbi:MAG: sigma-54-dependent Fis family transcriptional regulator [Proteobacteria bacterium]|nr:MAG: sigma-54-dependent Fis family transcriptional regulator [Pseudomonadota bacterium]